MSYSTKFSKDLLTWFDRHGRLNLPWQRSSDPYPVWVSEIMLQQTQVSTVIPFFEKFMATFPHLEDLANASLDEVLHLWTGLGYYARARNLHKTAQWIVNDQQGIFPSNQESLMQLPGIGRSTAGAIAAISFHQQAAILDGNVKRVLSRCFAVPGWPGKKTVTDQLWQLAEVNTPSERVADYTQAIMDLGATICKKASPACDSCPFQKSCIALQTATIDQYPGRKPKTARPTRSTCMLIIRNTKGAILLQRRTNEGLWGGLFSFPECREDELSAQLSALPGSTNYLAPFKHSFTHYDLLIQPILIELQGPIRQSQESETCWVSQFGKDKIGLTKPATQLLANLL